MWGVGGLCYHSLGCQAMNTKVNPAGQGWGTFLLSRAMWIFVNDPQAGALLQGLGLGFFTCSALILTHYPMLAKLRGIVLYYYSIMRRLFVKVKEAKLKYGKLVEWWVNVSANIFMSF